MSKDIDEILERLVNTIAVAPHLLYHSDEEKKELIENAIPNATQQIQALFERLLRESVGGDETVFEHRIGSHSDDWGGDSDRPCSCQDDAKERNSVRHQILETGIKRIKEM